MGALSNSSRHTANYVGFYKGLQSTGAAIMWSLDAHKTPYLTMWIANFALLVSALLCAVPVVFYKITDHVDVQDDVIDTGASTGEFEPSQAVVASGNEGVPAARLAHESHELANRHLRAGRERITPAPRPSSAYY